MSHVEWELAEVGARVEAIEAPLSLLLKRLNIAAEEPPPLEPSSPVPSLLGMGDKNGAIHAVMDETGFGLKDAKCHVESIDLRAYRGPSGAAPSR